MARKCLKLFRQICKDFTVLKARFEVRLGVLFTRMCFCLALTQNTGLSLSLIGCGQWLHWRSGLKRYPMYETQIVYTLASHVYTLASPASHTCDYTGYVGLAARSRTKSPVIIVLKHAKFSLHEKWNNCTQLYLAVSAERTKHERPPENTSWAWPPDFTGAI